MTAPATGKGPVAALLAGVEQMLSELDDDQWQQLVNRVRPPADDDEPAAATPKDSAAYPAAWNAAAKESK